MTKANNLIKISGLSYIIFSLFLISVLPFVAGPLLVIGIVLLANSFLTLEELNQKKAVLLIAAIISILFNQLAAVLLFISFDSISSAKKDSTNSPPTEAISTESKKIDILLKIGLAMVLIAGLLFATTTWDFITDIFKVISLIIMGLLFLGLSIFSEKKLKIEKTTKGYFILSLAFFVLTFIGIGYFAPFSLWFSYSGAGSSLVYFLTYLLVAGSFYLINYKFKDSECLYLGHAGMYFSIFSLLRFFTLPVMVVILIMTILTLIINIIFKNKNNSLKKFNEIATYLYFPLIITQSGDALFPVLLATAIVNIIDMLVQVFKNSSSVQSVFTAVISYVLLFTALINIPYNVDELLTLFITTTTFSLILKYSPHAKNKPLNITSQIIYHLSSLIIIIYYILVPSVASMIITAIYLVVNIISNSKLTKTNNIVDFFYQPIVIIYFVTSVLNYLYENVFEINIVFLPIICGLIYILIDCFSKQEKVKTYYLAYAIIATVLSFLINISVLNVVAGIAILLLSLYLYLRSTTIVAKICSYIFILLNIQILAISLLPNIYANILVLLVFGLLTLAIKDKQLNITNYMAFTVPLLSIINNMSDTYFIYRMIAINILQLYVVFLVVKFFIKTQSAKDIIATIFYAFFTSAMIFDGVLEFGIYIGLLAVIIIFITFNNDGYKKLFYTSVIVMVLNIIIQLGDFWAMIPFWLYLLLIGLSIIGFVTYKELTKDKRAAKQELNKEKKVEKEELTNDQLLETYRNFNQINVSPQPVQENTNEIKQNNQVQEQMTVGRFCPTCGTPNTHHGNFCKTCGRNLIIKRKDS